MENIQIKVDAGQWLGDLPHNWNYIGYDEINYTYVPEGQALLAKFAAMQEKPYYVRAHHLFCTGNGHAAYKWGSTNAYLEDENGQPLYDWHFVDLTLDTILQHHCKPFVELGFMPLHLVDPACYDIEDNVRSYRDYKAYGWACPPKDYQKWHDLVFELVQHCLERYGKDEILTWYWELWNEPDLDYYWRGSIDEFNKLYDYTAAAVKAACPECRVGGPGTTNPNSEGRSIEYLDKFLDHCANGTNAVTGETGTPLDFVTFHVKGGGYQADPLHRKQNPPSVQQILQDTQTGYQIISKYPGYNDLECILSEIDPDGWAAGGAWDNVNLNFRNTEYYASFVAAAFDKVSAFARQQDWDLRLLSWAFMFVGERCFEGTRTFSTQGIDKAIFNLFRLYAKLGNQAVAFSSSGAKDPLQYSDKWGFETDSDVSGFATLRGSKSLQVLVYNHHDDFERSDSSSVTVEVDNLAFESDAYSLTHYRVDAEHSNAYAEWLRQDKPMYPAPGQYAAIKARDGLELLEPPATFQAQDGTLVMHFDMPTHSISLLVFEEA